ncbi:MAG: T9SS type A sorting domain-containing protein, partial [Candidatus Zixiibacteriota bacterium]
WYTPGEQTLIAQVGRQHRFTLTGIDTTKPWVVNVAHRFGSSVGSPGTPLPLRFDILPATPVMLDTLSFFKQPTGAMVRWHQPAGPAVHHYNIYKFDSTWAANKFLPFYSTVRQTFDYNRIFYRNGQTWYYYALPIWTTVAGTESTYVDIHANDGDRYTVIAVDSDGYMSPYSGVVTMRNSTRSKDVLVIVDSDPSGNYVVRDSIRSYYNRLLSGYSHDIYSWYDSSAWPYCEGTTPACMDWHDFMKYRLIIIDDGMYDGILASWYEDPTRGFSTYLASGGQIAYFGSFSRMGGSYLVLTTNPGEYKRTHSLISQYFGIDSVFYVGALYYQRHSVPPYQDSLFAFYKGEAISPAPGDVFYDATHDRMKASFRSYWPATTPASVSTFHLTSAGQPIYTYRSLFPTKSMNEGQVAGVLTVGPTTTTYLYGFHLWYMDSTSAQSLVDWMVSQAPPAPSPARDAPPPVLEFASQNYPNPFNPSTTIGFTLMEREHVTITIYNLLGQIVRTLCDQDLEPGIHRVMWDGTSVSGHPVTSGVYFYRLIAGPNVSIKKMLLLK